MVKRYSVDTETTTTFPTRVWAWGLCEVGEPDTFECGDSLDGLMKRCEELENTIMYFHNLKFDGVFIIDWLERNGFAYNKRKMDKTYSTVISNMGQFYAITVIFKTYEKRSFKVVFYDSYKKLPFTVDKIGKDFKLDFQKISKGPEFYKKDRPIGYKLTDEDIEYLKGDVIAMAMALKIQFDRGMTRMTVGSDALGSFKEHLGQQKFRRMFPILSYDVDKDVRQAYRGGQTMAMKKWRYDRVGDTPGGKSYDKNSMYPWVMAEKPLPYDFPLLFQGKYESDWLYPLYIQHMVCEFRLKKDHIPTIQIKNMLMFEPTQYIEKTRKNEPVPLMMTNIDLDLFFRHYDVWNITYINGWKFKACTGVFDDWIFPRYESKSLNKGTAIGLLDKLELNNLYGKFATNPEVRGKIPYMDWEKNHIRFKLDEVEIREPVYTPLGVFITSYARESLVSTGQLVYDKLAYMDTDSLYLICDEDYEPPFECDPDKLGAWKEEHRYSKGRFIRSKTYQIQAYHPYEEHVIKCAGMPNTIQSVIEWNEFKIGFRSDTTDIVDRLKAINKQGKLKPVIGPGGIVLEEIGYTLNAKMVEDSEDYDDIEVRDMDFTVEI